MSNFDLSALALAAICPNNELLYDDLGMPSVMVKVPKLTYAQLGMGDSTALHPAFIINGQEVDAIWISKYQNVVENNRAYSLPSRDPKVCITFDEARQACESKGPGWHLMTRMEWGLLVRWCENNGFIPKGNNSYGRHSSEKIYRAIPTLYDTDGVPNRLASGTGPISWYHDNSPAGIADLCGNIWEWMGGMRTVKGELQILPDNNAADSNNSQAVDSKYWKAIDAVTGNPVTPNGNGNTNGTIKMDWVDSILTYSTAVTDTAAINHTSTFGSSVVGNMVGASAKLLLQNLGILCYHIQDLCSPNTVYFNVTEEERLYSSGGSWNFASSGLASFYGNYPRSVASTNIGFRSAFVELP